MNVCLCKKIDDGNSADVETTARILQKADGDKSLTAMMLGVDLLLIGEESTLKKGKKTAVDTSTVRGCV